MSCCESIDWKRNCVYCNTLGECNLVFCTKGHCNHHIILYDLQIHKKKYQNLNNNLNNIPNPQTKTENNNCNNENIDTNNDKMDVNKNDIECLDKD